MDFIVWSGDPILFSLGSLHVHWYGVMFALALFVGMKIMEWIFIKENKKVELVEHLFLYVIIGTVIGARLGHCLFYDPSYYLSNPFEIFAVWKGGLASHGGAMGVVTALYLFSQKYKYSYIWLLDRIVIPAVLAGAFIRLGNFFNSEIIGTPSQLPWAIIFSSFDNIPRHPAQLYEALAYFILAIIIFIIYKRGGSSLKSGTLFGFYLISIFSVRFMIEFVKFKQEAYSNDLILSTGQFLSIPFVLLGLYMLFFYGAKDSVTTL